MRLPVLRVDARRGLGVDRTQSCVQQARAALGELGLELRPQLGIGAREAEVVDHGRHVEPRAADEQRDGAPGGDLVDRAASGPSGRPRPMRLR